MSRYKVRRDGEMIFMGSSGTLTKSPHESGHTLLRPTARMHYIAFYTYPPLVSFIQEMLNKSMDHETLILDGWGLECCHSCNLSVGSLAITYHNSEKITDMTL
jgi:hypothetical protein